MKVKKFYGRPQQCHNCYEFGHVKLYCPQSSQRCYVCSLFHEEDECTLVRKCIHCCGDHSSNSKQCPKYKFEQEVVARAEDERISFGAARAQLVLLNSAEGSTFFDVARKEKIKRTRSRLGAPTIKKPWTPQRPSSIMNVPPTLPSSSGFTAVRRSRSLIDVCGSFATPPTSSEPVNPHQMKLQLVSYPLINLFLW